MQSLYSRSPNELATMERRPENSSAKIAEKSMSCLTTKLLFRVHYLISSDSDTDYSDFDNFADLWRNGFDRSDVCSRKTLESWLDYMQSNGGIDNWKNTHPCFLLNNLTLAAYLMKSQFTNLSRKLFNDVRFSTADVEQILDDLHITDDSSKKYSNAILSISRKPITEEIVNNIFEPYKIRFMREGENTSNVIEPAEPSLRDIKDKLKKILDEAEASDDEEESFVTDEESEVYIKVQESEEYKTVQEVILKFSKEKPDNECDLRKSLLNIIATSTRLLALLADTHNQESTSSGTKTKSRKRHKSYEIENSLSCENEVIMKKKKGHSMPKRYSINELIPRVIIERIDPRRISQEKLRDLSLHDNAKTTKNNTRSDTESSQDIQFLQESSTLTLGNNEETHKNELSNDIEIEFECKNVKPTVTSFVSQNLNISIDCEPNNQNEKIPQLQLVEKSDKSVKSKVTSKSTLRTIRNWTSRKRHKCDTCKKKFKSKFTLDNHINKMHKVITLPCDSCGKTFTREDYLNNHIDSVHKGVTYPCELCDQIFKLKHTLKYHKDFVHNVQKSQNCNAHKTTFAQKCPKSFNYKNNLSSNINTVHESKNYPCNLCQKVFRTKFGLKEHSNFMHNGIGHPCNLCGKSFSGQYKLKRHINGVHYGIRQ